MPIDYDELYRSRPVWDIGGPQPAIDGVLHEARGPKALDIGCGSGDLALALARRGLDVTGVDISATAIDQARAKAAAAGLTIHFEIQDATRLQLANAPFNSIFDSGLLHWLTRYDLAADDYLALLPGLAAPGATVFVLAVTEAAGGQSWGITEDLLRNSFTDPLWTDTTTEPAVAHADVDGETVQHRALLLRTTRTTQAPGAWPGSYRKRKRSRDA